MFFAQDQALCILDTSNMASKAAAHDYGGLDFTFATTFAGGDVTKTADEKAWVNTVALSPILLSYDTVPLVRITRNTG